MSPPCAVGGVRFGGLSVALAPIALLTAVAVVLWTGAAD